MSTQFFERQDTARGNTFWLIALFASAVVGLVGVTSVAGYAIALYVFEPGTSPRMSRTVGGHVQADVDPLAVAAVFGAAAAIVIIAGSLYQVTALRLGGGRRVAESVGGRQISANVSDPALRRLMNVVEEMAIASGTPVPPVYLLEEEGINAFAAGYLPGDAVIGVTRGAVEQLNREQLQGVIAHEFSHIFNGDMRMNIRMIGVLHGVLLLSLIGHMLIRSVYYTGGHRSRSDSNRGDGRVTLMLVVSGLLLVILGSVGSFIGGLIKAAVSRQREYLADASAVQFTRNPDGIAGALKRIGGFSQHGRLQHPNAGMASHMYFAQGVYEGLTGLLATHPPLPQRIRAIQPSWDGTFPPPARGGSAAATAGRPPRQASGFTGAAPLHAPAMVTRGGAATETATWEDAAWEDTDVSLPEVLASVGHRGTPQTEHRRYSLELLEQLDPELIDAAHETYSARALVLALLIDRDPEMRQRQFAALREMIAEDIVHLTRRLYPKVAQIPQAARLPLVDLSLPMLRMMTAPQYSTFAAALQAMIEADSKLTIFEWTLSRVLMRHLASEYAASPAAVTRYYRLGRLAGEVSVLLSVMARVGHRGSDVEIAFRAAAEQLPGIPVRLLPAERCSFRTLDAALEKLAQASVQRRSELLAACATSVAADGLVKVREAELLRGIADLLDCPMPPLVGAVQRERDRG